MVEYQSINQSICNIHGADGQPSIEVICWQQSAFYSSGKTYLQVVRC